MSKYELPQKLSSNYYAAFEGRLVMDDLAGISEFDFGCEGKEKTKIDVDRAKIKTIVESHVTLPWPKRHMMVTFVKLLYKEIGPYGMARLTKHLRELCFSRRNESVAFCGKKPEFWRQFDIKSRELASHMPPEPEDTDSQERPAKRLCNEAREQ